MDGRGEENSKCKPIPAKYSQIYAHAHHKCILCNGNYGLWGRDFHHSISKGRLPPWVQCFLSIDMIQTTALCWLEGTKHFCACFHVCIVLVSLCKLHQNVRW